CSATIRWARILSSGRELSRRIVSYSEIRCSLCPMFSRRVSLRLISSPRKSAKLTARRSVASPLLDQKRESKGEAQPSKLNPLRQALSGGDLLLRRRTVFILLGIQSNRPLVLLTLRGPGFG